MEFIRTFEREGTKYLVIQLDEAGLSSLRQNQYRLQMGMFGILSFETHRPPAPQSAGGGPSQSGRSNQPVSAVDDLARTAAAMALRSPAPKAQPMEQGTPKPSIPPTITVEGIEPIPNQAPAAVLPGGAGGNTSDKGEESDFDGVEIGGEEVEELGEGAEDRGKQGNRGNPATHGNHPDRVE